MKRKSQILLMIIFALAALIVAVPSVAQAQQSLSPNGQTLYYTQKLYVGTDTGRAYLANTLDTLPNAAYHYWYTSTTQSYKLGGASFVSLHIQTYDSLYADFYIDELIGTTWTQIYNDSIKTAVAISKEYVIRSTATEKSGNLSGRYRYRRSVRNVTQGVSSAMIKESFLWKP